MKRVPRLMLVFPILLVLVVVDQVTKQLAMQYLYGAAPIIFLGDLFRLQYAENTGAFLSLGSGRVVMITGLNLVILSVIGGVLLLRRTLGAGVSVALALILAGGVGNLIDRLTNEGRVVDFMNMGIGSLRTGIFNVADLGIVGGLLLLVALEIVRPKHDAETGKDAEESAGES